MDVITRLSLTDGMPLAIIRSFNALTYISEEFTTISFKMYSNVLMCPQVLQAVLKFYISFKSCFDNFNNVRKYTKLPVLNAHTKLSTEAIWWELPRL